MSGDGSKMDRRSAWEVARAFRSHIYSSNEALNTQSDEAHGGKKQMACYYSHFQRRGKRK